ncbi:MAG: hypothetical protein R3318_03750, partial [Gammaproteobacteria bacterium]|nr:hypothetical protein [Gammaproteobacteria bacterium]
HAPDTGAFLPDAKMSGPETGTSNVRDPSWPGSDEGSAQHPRTGGVVSFGSFSLDKQRKGTRSSERNTDYKEVTEASESTQKIIRLDSSFCWSNWSNKHIEYYF